MTRLRDLQQHRRSLGEIRDILNSMKTLAYMETRKLARFQEAQAAVVAGIEQAADDLVASYPELLPRDRPAATVYVLIGTERGFCGDFNRLLLRRAEGAVAEHRQPGTKFLAVGRKLAMLLQDDERVADTSPGPSAAEEVPQLLQRLVSQLTALHHDHGNLAVSCVYHRDQGDIKIKRLLPPFQSPPGGKPVSRHPPVLNLSPRETLSGLAEHYVLALLHQMLYSSLWAENSRRVAHLEGAVRHLDEQEAELTRQSQALRQEEIVEEIEVMLLGADAGALPGSDRKRSSSATTAQRGGPNE